MTKDQNRKKPIRSQQENPGFISGMSRTIRLVLRLMLDRRVNFFLKLLPIGALVYMVSPLDAVIPFVDDAMVVGIGTYVFIELCPPDVVEEHRAQLAGTEGDGQPADDNGEVVDVHSSDHQGQ